MKKVELFKHIGEAYAKHENREAVARPFFQILAEELYPNNQHRRYWAYDCMINYFEIECERDLIMRKLKGKTKGDDILDMIRKRQAQ